MLFVRYLVLHIIIDSYSFIWLLRADVHIKFLLFELII